ncbi:MAG TPA: SpoIIE family protein phosphatase, partial [Spirochaetota bacterium]|nr:SpoIIE family protein phosphatase [Spirochaetota bacterium]
IAIIPLFLVFLMVSQNLYSYLEKQNKNFYKTLLIQVANNISFIFEQYALTCNDITLISNFDLLVNHPPYQSKEEERSLYAKLGEEGDNPKGGSIRRATMSKVKGDLMVIELDRKSLLDESALFKRHYFSPSGSTVVINDEKLLSDPLFLSLVNNPEKKIVFGKFQKGVISGFNSEKRAFFIYPYYYPDEQTFRKFLLVTLDFNYLRSIYKDVNELKYGTLFVLDEKNNIVLRNHPDDDDYYSYNEDEKKYELGEDDPNDPTEMLKFEDYKLLVTDEDILKNKDVADVLSKLNINDYDNELGDEKSILHKPHFIKYNNEDYLVLFEFESLSQTKLVYFFPISQITKPIYNFIMIILYIIIGVIVVVVLISLFYSKLFTKPINRLTEGALRISNGDYKISVDMKNFFGEFLFLGDTFNSMITMIHEYSNNMEDLVAKRTEELNKANQELSVEYERSKRELMMAQKIQDSLIPKVFPNIDMVNFSGIYLPMDNLGGDLYDVYKISKTKIGILILDVCGHGVPAALITTMAKVSFNNNSKKNLTTGEVMEIVNNEIYEIIKGSSDYFTAFYSIIDTETRALEYTNSGHNEIYVLKSDKTLIELQCNSPVVGAVLDVRFVTETIMLDDRDKIILYTDGVPEARNSERELYGAERFKNLILENANLDANNLVNKIFEAIKSFKGDEESSDDIAVLVTEVKYDKQNKLKLDFTISTDQIKQQIDQITELSYKDKELNFLKAIELYNDNQNKEAINVLLNLKGKYNRNNDNFKILNLLAYCYYKIGDFKNAIDNWEEALKYSPNNKDVISNIDFLKK